MIDRLDEERLEILRSWGAGLSADHREELRAAAKAIMVLIEEIDRLQIDLWHARAVRPDPQPAVPVPAADPIRSPPSRSRTRSQRGSRSTSRRRRRRRRR